MSLFKIIKKLFKCNSNNTAYKNDSNLKIKEILKQGETEISKNNFDLALKLFEQAINLDPNCDYPYGDKALILDKMGKFKESLEMYSKALDLNPKNSITWYNKGLTFVNLKKIEEAIHCFDNAISFDENYSKAWYIKGRCFELLGNLEKAQYCLNVAKKLDPFLFTKMRMNS
ncbi:MAG TPA: tetratricopeptide repeat protein [Candidatus Sulfopaludibacter sp.]|nr:tetratricopeptide repeat protein [Candidatus Sulfopaludibacter sp.]